MNKDELQARLYALSEELQDEFLERYGLDRVSDAGTEQLEEYLREAEAKLKELRGEL